MMDAVAKKGKSDHTIDVGTIVDNGRWSNFQKLILVLAAIAVLLDTFDSQLMGLAVPAISKDWDMASVDFASVLAIGLIGLTIGSASSGYLGDRFGRRTILVGCLLLFGLSTVGISLSQNVIMISIFRFLCGVGIGGVQPMATTIVAEYTPISRRTMGIVAAMTCSPLGGMLAGLFAAWILPSYGWRAMFLAGGGIALAFSLILFLRLPETLRWLARHRSRWSEMKGILRRMGVTTDERTQFVDVAEQKIEHGFSFVGLLEDGRVRTTIPLWIAFFLSMVAAYTTYGWLPTMLSRTGLPLSISSSGLAAYNFGSIGGALLSGIVIHRFGSRWPMVLSPIFGALSVFSLIGIDIQNHPGYVSFAIGASGFFSGAILSPIFAFAAYSYPTNIRATGVAAAMAMGRLGAIFSSYMGAEAITYGGADAYFSVIGVATVGVSLAMFVVRDHMPPASVYASGK